MKKEISNQNINMNERDLKKLSKSELIALLMKQQKPKIIVVDDTKPSPKSERREKVVTQDDLLDNDEFPDFVITSDPFERKIDNVNNKKRDIDRQSLDIDSKHQNLMSEPVQVAHKNDTSSTQKIRHYPKIKTTLDEFRKDEMKMSTDKTRRHTSFINLFETRLNKITGNRETVSMSLNVDINVPSFRKLEKGVVSSVDEFDIPIKKVINSNYKNMTVPSKYILNTSTKIKVVEKSYGPFTVEKPVILSKQDIYKFAMYTLLKIKIQYLVRRVYKCHWLQIDKT